MVDDDEKYEFFDVPAPQPSVQEPAEPAQEAKEATEKEEVEAGEG